MVNLKEVRRLRAVVVWVFADVTGQSWTKVAMRRKDSFTESGGRGPYIAEDRRYSGHDLRRWLFLTAKEIWTLCADG